MCEYHAHESLFEKKTEANAELKAVSSILGNAYGVLSPQYLPVML